MLRSKIQTPSGKFRRRRPRNLGSATTPVRLPQRFTRKLVFDIPVQRNTRHCRVNYQSTAPSVNNAKTDDLEFLCDEALRFMLPILRREARLVARQALLLRLEGLAGSRAFAVCA